MIIPRKLQVVFRRDPSRDRAEERIHFEGYSFYWPDGEATVVGLDAFCQHGQRALGLNRYLRQCEERMLELLCIPLETGDEPMTRIQGVIVRRFYLERRGRAGRVHFLDGTPTAIVFNLDNDDRRVLHWIGLSSLREGEQQWFDVAAQPCDSSSVPTHGNLSHSQSPIYGN